MVTFGCSSLMTPETGSLYAAHLPSTQLPNNIASITLYLIHGGILIEWMINILRIPYPEKECSCP
jgi:hypothetical protein